MIERRVIDANFDYMLTLPLDETTRVSFRASDVSSLNQVGQKTSVSFYTATGLRPYTFNVPFEELRDAVYGPPLL